MICYESIAYMYPRNKILAVIPCMNSSVMLQATDNHHLLRVSSKPIFCCDNMLKTPPYRGAYHASVRL
ncbi:MAG: hypothetical protein ACTS73_06295 [Arsenophonus sp. NEOnobi-MAG3]